MCIAHLLPRGLGHLRLSLGPVAAKHKVVALHPHALAVHSVNITKARHNLVLDLELNLDTVLAALLDDKRLVLERC